MHVHEREELDHYTSISDQHSAWHRLNGWNNGCPLDCADADPEPSPQELADEIAWDLVQRGIRCGHCHGRRPSLDWVRACSAR